MRKSIIITDKHGIPRRVYLRGQYALEYRTLQDLEYAKSRAASKRESSNPKLAERIRTMDMLEWLNTGGAIFRTEKL